MSGALLDTHALYWLVSGTEQLATDALIAIGRGQRDGNLTVSPITAWEIALAARKTRNAPGLGDMLASDWFRAALRVTSATIAPINQRTAVEAANVVAATGHRDPGDCYLIATARVRKMAIITRDDAMREMSVSGYLEVIRC
ncbi:type II toxin-antitoxin system VapC family toxin [Agrobacterium sp. a22-2]|uniref:type II toxin-antitoxin system VapC family toxin n=1 Tax=Agrobacterium sp. a22-2 TaxID=2283840 RepID=UPI0014453151|nr:type II toxin-antitoxin system VapC family toxin [Agrobacterium sp. a22-2]NKN39514.1 type II toxin-antitoxin system VapC family toxin [Agrobacterium sp. a22-2]